jgi:hypothetical protein
MFSASKTVIPKHIGICKYNTATKGGERKGLFSFMTAHSGPRGDYALTAEGK